MASYYREYPRPVEQYFAPLSQAAAPTAFSFSHPLSFFESSNVAPSAFFFYRLDSPHFCLETIIALVDLQLIFLEILAVAFWLLIRQAEGV